MINVCMYNDIHITYNNLIFFFYYNMKYKVVVLVNTQFNIGFHIITVLTCLNDSA